MNVHTSSSPPASPRRRQWLYAGVAAGAGLAGTGLAWWRFQSHTGADAAVAALWAQHFDAVQHGQPPLAMASFKGRPLLLNFWATWCPPCVHELPLLDAFYREHAARGWQVLGLAVDQPAAVQQFMARTPLGFPVAMVGMGGVDVSRSLGNLAGALPFTVLFGADGGIMHRKMGQISAANLAEWATMGG